MPCALISLIIAKICCDQDRREAQRRLVEEQHPRLGHQRPADGEHLLLAARQRAALLAGALAQPREQVEDALDVGLDRRSGRG